MTTNNDPLATALRDLATMIDNQSIDFPALAPLSSLRLTSMTNLDKSPLRSNDLSTR